jgi:transposase
LEILYDRVAGLDVHKTSVTVTVRLPDPDHPGRRVETTKRYRAFYRDLLELAGWLVVELGVDHAAMEATGVYWVPVWQALREIGGEDLHIDVVNAQHFKAVPGRKTDVKDSQWLAQLLECGLLRGSFIPPQPVRALRDLTRYRTKLTEERSREKQRLLKVLELAGIKLDNVASDTFGVSGRDMLRALADGERDPDVLADLARGVLRRKFDDLRLALAGRFTPHHADMIGLHLTRLDDLDRMLTQIDRRIGALPAPAVPASRGGSRRGTATDQPGPPGAAPPPPTATGLLAPFATQVALLTTIPGIGERTATAIVSEIGVDMTRFPTPAHLAAWAGLAPGNNESAGKRRRAGRRKGNTHLAATMVEAASAAARTNTRVGARFHRLHGRFGGKRRRPATGTDPGWKKAAFATAHTLIKIVYRVLATSTPYQDLGSDFYDRPFDPDLTVRRLIARLEGITGHTVALTAPVPPGSTPPTSGATAA